MHSVQPGIEKLSTRVRVIGPWLLDCSNTGENSSWDGQEPTEQLQEGGQALASMGEERYYHGIQKHNRNAHYALVGVERQQPSKCCGKSGTRLAQRG